MVVSVNEESTMEPATEQFVRTNLLACCACLDSSIALIGESCGEEFFTQYRREAGYIMGHLFLEILRGLIDLDKGPDNSEELSPSPSLARDAAIEAAMAKIDEARQLLESVERFVEQARIQAVGQKWLKAMEDGFGMIDALAGLLESQASG